MIKNILSETSWWPVNKHFTRKYGIDSSIIISDLSSKQEYWENRKMLTEDGFFYCEKLEIEKDTSISPYRQDKAVKLLVNLGVLNTEIRKGIPPKRYYRVNVEKLNELVKTLYNRDSL